MGSPVSDGEAGVLAVPQRPVDALLGHLQEVLGRDIDEPLLLRALTHRSYAYENGGVPNNERLEFLGDSVLGLVVTETLYRGHPDLAEGQLAKLRAAVVNMRALADVARTFDLGQYVMLGKGEEATGGRDKASILADTMEALIGTVFLSTDIEHAAQFIHHHFDALIEEAATWVLGSTGRRASRRWPRRSARGPRSIASPSRAPTMRRSSTPASSSATRCSVRGMAAARRKPSRRPPRRRGTPWTGVGLPAPRLTPKPRRVAQAEPDAELPDADCMPEPPRSRWSAVDWRTTSSGAGSPAPRSPACGSHAATSPGRGTWPLGSRERRSRRRPAGASTCGSVLDADEALIVHLGMSGQMLVKPAGLPRDKHCHAVFDFVDGGPQLHFVDQRTFRGLALSPLTPDGVPAAVAHIAPDPFEASFDQAAVVRRRRPATAP